MVLRIPFLTDVLIEKRILAAKAASFRPRKINLSGCYQISMDTFLRLTQNHEVLTELDISGCYQLFGYIRRSCCDSKRLRKQKKFHFDQISDDPEADAEWMPSSLKPRASQEEELNNFKEFMQRLKNLQVLNIAGTPLSPLLTLLIAYIEK